MTQFFYGIRRSLSIAMVSARTVTTVSRMAEIATTSTWWLTKVHASTYGSWLSSHWRLSRSFIQQSRSAAEHILISFHNIMRRTYALWSLSAKSSNAMVPCPWKIPASCALLWSCQEDACSRGDISSLARIRRRKPLAPNTPTLRVGWPRHFRPPPNQSMIAQQTIKANHQSRRFGSHHQGRRFKGHHQSRRFRGHQQRRRCSWWGSGRVPQPERSHSRWKSHLARSAPTLTGEDV